MIRIILFSISLFLYQLIYFLFCNSKDFKIRGDPGNEKIDLFNLFYFSIITQSTIGFGDIVPQTKKSKLIVILQVYTGYLIMTIPNDYINYFYPYF